MQIDNKILVTGVAGFIGFHLTKRLLRDGYSVVGIDNLNDYYDVALKKNRLEKLRSHDGFFSAKLTLETTNRWNVFSNNTKLILQSILPRRPEFDILSKTRRLM